MSTGYAGKNALARFLSNIKSKFALATHTHTAADVGADSAGSASSALSSAKSYADNAVSTHAATTTHITSTERTNWNAKAVKPTESAQTSSFTVADNYIYTVSSLASAITITIPASGQVYSSLIRVTFADGGSISGFTNCSFIDGDDYTSAVSGDTWEFSVLNGSVICKNLTAQA